MHVPSRVPTSRIDAACPPSMRTSVPLSAPRARVRITKCDTDAMLGSASPRNPSVRIAPRSSGREILLVACRSTASCASVRLHALAVVLDANQLLAAELDGDRDPRRTRIERVLDQFLDHRGRPLDDFAGGNLIGEVQGKAVNATHLETQFNR